MSVMFDPDTAIYPFPPKPTPLSIDEKEDKTSAKRT